MAKVFYLEGLEKLSNKLKKNIKMADVKRVVSTNGAELTNKMTRSANFVKGYQTGTTKRSIQLSKEDSGFTAIVEPGTEYSPYLEYGTRKMEAQPFVGPAFNEQKEIFKKDMKKLVEWGV